MKTKFSALLLTTLFIPLQFTYAMEKQDFKLEQPTKQAPFTQTANGKSGDLLFERLSLMSFLAHYGHPKAQYDLASHHFIGLGVKKDINQAIRWYCAAAEQGHMEAQYNLASLYYCGGGIKKDMNQAIKWFSAAASMGHLKAQHILGVLYYFGEEIDHNIEKSIELFSNAADQGHCEAQYNLGKIFEDGWIQKDGATISPNLDKAIYWYTKAVNQDYADAQLNLGKLYYHGKGVAQNTAKSLELFFKASGQGSETAKNNFIQLLPLRPISSASANSFDQCQVPVILNILETLRYTFGFYKGLNNSISNLDDLDELFFSRNNFIDSSITLVKYIQKEPSGFLLTCLEPGNEEIKTSLIETLIDGISAHTYKDEFYLSLGDEAAKLSRSLITTIQPDGSIDKTLKTLTDNHDQIEKFISQITYDKKQNVGEMTKFLTNFKQYLESYITDNAQKRNDVFIKEHNWWR